MSHGMLSILPAHQSVRHVLDYVECFVVNTNSIDG